MRYLVLIPTHSLWIAEVEHGILIVQGAIGILHCHATLHEFVEVAVLRGEVRQLPQTGMEAILLQTLQHAHWVLEAILGKLVVALPIDTKPSGIEVDDISWYLVGSQLVCYLQSLLLREVRDAAHPSAEGPERKHRRLACHVGIFIENVLWFAEEDEEVHRLITHEEALRSDVAGTEIGCGRSRSVHEEAIATVGEIERHRFVHAIGLRSLWIDHGDIDLLSHLVERGETLTTTIDALTRRKHKHRVDTAGVIATTLDEVERKQLHLCAIVVDDMTSLGEYLSMGITEHQAERILLDFQRAVLVLVDDAAVGGCGVPSSTTDASVGIACVLSDKLRGEHRVVGIVHLRTDRRREKGDTQGAVVYLLNLDTEVRVVVILGVGEVKHLHSHGPVAIEIERLARCQAITLPVEQSLALVEVETCDAIGEEVGVCQVGEVARHVSSLALQVFDAIVGVELCVCRQSRRHRTESHNCFSHCYLGF